MAVIISWIQFLVWLNRLKNTTTTLVALGNNMDYNKTAALLKTSRPLEIFKKIVGFNEQAQSLLEMGRVRIGLASGFTLEGTPVKLDADSNAVFISENNSISYVNAASLAGIEVLNPELLMEVLAD